MSFMGQATATALPAEVQLAKEKPQGAFCLRSRYALSANSANSWLAGSLVSLPLQTGTPGTFTDVKQGNINCTLQISNTNPYVDFMNFGPCGAIIFFDEMRVYSSGTPVEENLNYSETVDLLMEQGGWQCRPYHVFRRNKWRAANGRAGNKHINFVKPSMVDVYGCPMFGRTPLMDKNSAVYQPPAIAFGVQQTTGQVGNSTGSGVLALANTFNNLALLSVSKADTTPTNASFGSILGSDTGYTFNDDGISQADSRTANGNYNSADSGRGYNNGLIAGRVPSVISANANGQYKADPSAWKNTQVGRTPANAPYVNSSATSATFPWTAICSFVPSQWPDYQPCTLCGDIDDYEIDQIIGKTKVAEYMKYLANVRSIPIGVKGNNESYVSNVNQLSVSTTPGINGPSSRFVEYRVSMPFVSGIYGILADKMFPDLLIGANNIRIEFKLAQNQKALWLTMDPCRRIPGTVRDWVPFTGEVSGTARGKGITAAYPFASSGNSATNTNRQASALGCFNSRVCYYDSSADANYGGQTMYTNSTSTVQTAAAATLFAIIRDSNMYNTSSALGEDLISPQISATAAGLPQGNGITAGGHYSSFSNLPKPQYIPCPTPWVKKSYFVSGTNTTALHCNENAGCFGTYLPASVPQTRRCQPSSRLAISDSVFGSSGTTAFAIRDIQYIGEQVQLDDISASAIIQQAATSEIVVWTRGYRTFNANATSGSEQNIILPIQIGQATALYTVFRPGIQVLNFDYYSNSFVCPFVGLSFDGSKSGVDASQAIYYGRHGRQADVGGVYTINSTLDTQNQGLFSYQLFSGTRQYPLQPIQTVSDLLVEREKSTHSLHNWSWVGTENMHLMQWDKNFNSSTSTGYLFDPFLDLGFFTTFIPTLALDDQTITQNPYMSIAEVNEDGYPLLPVRGIRQTPYISTVQSQFVGVLNQFVPPVGTFFLGWDFESWTNHDDLMRTGKFLGQEQLTLRMTGCKLMEAINPATSYGPPLPQPIGVLAIVPHVVKLSFVPGGHMLSYY